MNTTADQVDELDETAAQAAGGVDAQTVEEDGRVLAEGHWSLKHGDDIYGPYTYEAMEAYIAEGRVAGHSIIAKTGTEEWQPAKDVPIFAGFFDEERANMTSSTPSHPRDREPVYGPKKGQIDRRKRPETSNFIVITDIKSRHGATLEQNIMALGSVLKVANNAWIINCAGTAPGILNQLSKVVSKQDGLFVADATRDRTAWFNFGPETDAKIRRVWRKPV